MSHNMNRFPVLFNVFAGNMSFFGPKTVTVHYAEMERQQDLKYSYRFRVKPGIISYADVYSTDNTTDMDRLKMDIYYIQNYSISLNLKLFLMYMKKAFST